ncbi:MAG: hypothetical protein HYV27_21070 [Candidatus Hydrogenedentes bacterium]|nr:hypothetical protein [Candidatus Hydrogenedentota bacterium]
MLTEDTLQKHIFETYFCLRLGMAVIALAFPILLWGYGCFHGIGLQNSMSAYYWASAPGSTDSPVRVWFIGVLFAIGAFLYLYKGFSAQENIALNLAAIFAIGVAYFPMEWNCGGNCQSFSAHGTSAILFFLCLAYVAWFRAGDTLDNHKSQEYKETYRKLYRFTALLMVASPVTAAVLLLVLQLERNKYVFVLEAIAIWAFALYWAIKTTEMRKSNLEFAPARPTE